MRIESGIAALVLAAGYSSRASAFKPLLPLGDATIIERVINNFHRADIHDITVVVGHRADELLPVLAPLHVRCVYNENYDEGMFSSVVTGLRSFPQGMEAFFLLPVDIPLVRSHTIRLLCRAFTRRKADVVYPVFQAQRGHPPLIATRCIPEILAGNKTGGLRPILEQYEAQAYELEVLDEAILLDADTPADYQKILQYHCRRNIPSEAECKAILARMNVPDNIIRHGMLVAEVARKLATRLNRAGLSIDVNLVIAAGKLHDLAKGNLDHARIGARILKKMGYPKAAQIIATHTDIEFAEGRPLDEAAIIYLADKLVKRDRVVSINERFQSSMKKYEENAEVASAIMKRLLMAQTIGKTVEQIAGVSLEEALAAEY